MREIEFCPECGAPVVGDGTAQMCTSCGLMYHEMQDLLDDDDLMEDDLLDDEDVDPDDDMDRDD
jgi:hypothetical protein